LDPQGLKQHRPDLRDEEYRSEEALPQTAKDFFLHSWFKSYVLFAIDPNGRLHDQPEVTYHIHGMEALRGRLRSSPHVSEYADAQMKSS
jgi:hypothetical protein